MIPLLAEVHVEACKSPRKREMLMLFRPTLWRCCRDVLSKVGVVEFECGYRG
jgi:hypothetical protein